MTEWLVSKYTGNWLQYKLNVKGKHQNQLQMEPARFQGKKQT